MTSSAMTVSSDKRAYLVGSSLELLTRPASKPDDQTNSSPGELCTSRVSRRRGESRFLSARVNLKHSNCFLASNRADLHFTLDFPTRNQFLKLDLDRPMVAHFTKLQTICRSGCSACSAYPYEKINNRVAASKDSPFRKIEALSQHFCNLQAVDSAGFSRCLQITQNFSNAEVHPEGSI